MLIDTHCHLHFEEFRSDRPQTIQRAVKNGISVLLNVGTEPGLDEAGMRLSEQYPFMYSSVGFHPHYVHQGSLDKPLYHERLQHPKVVAVGEIGLDYYKSQASREEQRGVFSQMILLALEYHRPIIVHSREAFEDTYQTLRGHALKGMKGVFHCFSYGGDELKKVLDLGFLVSFTGNITFKNAKALREVVRQTPLDKMLLETDSPYLAPQSVRGKRNEPAYLVEVADQVALLKNLSREEVDRVTTENARNLFGI